MGGVDAGAETVGRSAARVVVLDSDDRVLLLHARDSHRPDEPYWLTPGGGVEDGEDLITCAARELHEETGLRLDRRALAGPVRRETVEFPFEGMWFRQEQEYFVARVGGGADVAPAALSVFERRSWLGYRWWALSELEASAERYYPEDLPELLRELGVSG